MSRRNPIRADEDDSDDDGVKLSVEETEPARTQSSVRPFHSDYDTYDLRDSDEEAEEAEDADEAEEVSQLENILQLSVREEERGNLLARSLDESSEVNNYTDGGVKLSVEETEPEWTQSSVRPFYSDYDTYDLRDSDEEAE